MATEAQIKAKQENAKRSTGPKTIEGKQRSSMNEMTHGIFAQLPVMDFRNHAILNPNAYEVNTAMQRCLAKAISLYGIGLYIYAGEDLTITD